MTIGAYGTGGLAAELAAAGFTDAVKVGSGGFGAIYRCQQPAIGRTVAVKVLSADLDEDNRERFYREAHAMGRLSGHPTIVTIIQVGETASHRPYIVMPFYERDSLAARLRREGPLPWPEAVSTGVKLCGALETAHRAGILHRDVKPANILVSDYGDPHLTDFGIARMSGGFKTATGSVTGSLPYLPPEVMQGETPTAAADVYSLGATVFELVSGSVPHPLRPGEDPIALLMRISSGVLPDLRPRGVPGDVCEVLARALAPRPADRFPTAEEFGLALAQVQQRHHLPVDAMAVRQLDLAAAPPQPAPPTGTTRIGIGAAGWPQTAPPTQQPVYLPTGAATHHQPTYQPVYPPTGIAPPAPGFHTGPPTAFATAPPAPARRRRAAPVLAALLVLVLAGVVAAWLLTRGGGADNGGPGATNTTTAVVADAGLTRDQYVADADTRCAPYNAQIASINSDMIGSLNPSGNLTQLADLAEQQLAELRPLPRPAADVDTLENLFTAEEAWIAQNRALVSTSGNDPLALLLGAGPLDDTARAVRADWREYGFRVCNQG